MTQKLCENPKPNLKYFGEDNATHTPPRKGKGCLTHTALLAAAEYNDLLTFKQAMNLDDTNEWCNACQYEMDVLAKNGTWRLMGLPPGCKAVKLKWVFKWKADGCFHTHLVAKGFTQIQGIDYDETFSPVARFESLRLLLALAALED